MKPIFKTVIASILSIAFLTACEGAVESPEEVMSKMKQNLSEVNSGDFSGDIAMTGSGQGETVDFNIDLALKFDRIDVENRAMELELKTAGTMSALEETVDADVDLQFKTVGEQYYIRLNKFDSTDQNINEIKPLLDTYISKWLHISSDFIPEDIRKLQDKDEETLAKEAQLKELFLSTNLFTIVKEYGIDTLDGKKMYHYGIELDQKGVQDYIRATAVIEGRELTDEEIAEASKIATYLKGAEIWVGSEDYYPYKFTIKIDSEALGQEMAQQDSDMQIIITLRGSDYNKPMNISVPADAQEFNPLELLMSYSMMNAQMDEDGTSAAEEMTDEERQELMNAIESGMLDESDAMDVMTEDDTAMDVVTDEATDDAMAE